ncbi:polymorphic PE/PPE family protein [Mycobacterium ulcerans str. Harvey]|nr:polymorphic PE/PPE family protein [Mycobacterium ulcerans str. Harvey]
MGLASPITSAIDATGLGGIIQDIEDFLGIPFVANVINGAVNTAAWYTTATIPTAIFLANALNTGAPVIAAEGAIEAAEGAAAATAGLANTVTPTGVGAALGEATLVGKLAVPTSWSNALPETAATTGALGGSGWTVPEEAAPVSGVAGVPGMAAAAKGAGAYAGPRYGFKPIVMPKQVVV